MYESLLQPPPGIWDLFWYPQLARIRVMSHGQALAIGAAENPGGVARAVLDHLRDDVAQAAADTIMQQLNLVASPFAVAGEWRRQFTRVSEGIAQAIADMPAE